MSKITVGDILATEPNSFQGLTKTTFLHDGQAVYIFTKAGNEPSVGDTLDGDIAPDKAGKLKFTKTKVEGFDRQAYTGPKKGVPSGGGRDDKAIQSQWAIGQSVQLNLASSAMPREVPREALFAQIEKDAKQFFAMIERVKTSDRPTVEDAKQVITELFPGASEIE